MNGRLSVAAVILALAASAPAQYVEDSIDVGGAWVGSLAYDSAGEVVWGSTWSAHRVFAIDCSSNAIMTSIAVNDPGDLALDAVDRKLYCAYSGSDEDSMVVIGCSTYSIVKRFAMQGATMPVWDPVTNRLYVTCQTMNRVAVIDCATDSLMTYIPVGICPIKQYLNTLRRKLYVLNYDDGTVSVVDLVTWQVQRTVRVGGNPNAGYYSRRADKFYCGGEPGFVIAIDGRSNGVVTRIPVAWHGDVLGATGNDVSNLALFGAYNGHGAVYAVTTLGDSVTDVIPVSGSPYGLAYSPGSDRFYCGNGRRDSVLVLAGDGSHVTKSLAVGHDPFVFAVVGRHNRIYVGDLGNRRVYVIRDSATGIAEEPASSASEASHPATLLRAALMATGEAGVLMDAAGRRVAEVGPGRARPRLAPGIYFVREAQAQAQAQARTVRKVVVLK